MGRIALGINLHRWSGMKNEFSGWEVWAGHYIRRERGSDDGVSVRGREGEREKGERERGKVPIKEGRERRG